LSFWLILFLRCYPHPPKDIFKRTSPPPPFLKERGVNPIGSSLLLKEKGLRDEVLCVESYNTSKKDIAVILALLTAQSCNQITSVLQD
jgi:hypothetical protein